MTRACSVTFEPPTISERPDTGNRLIDCWVHMYRGVTILKSAGGVYASLQYPTQDDIADAAIAYQGGHIYDITETEATALIAAGYGSGVTTGYQDTYCDCYF